MIRPVRRPFAFLALASLVAIGSCELPTGVTGNVRLAVTAVPVPSAANAGALPVHRVRVFIESAADGAFVYETTLDAPSPAAPWEIEVGVDIAETVEAVAYFLFLNAPEGGPEEIVYSGRSDAVTLEVVEPEAGAEPADPIPVELDLVRGPIANLFVTGVTITEAPSAMEPGEEEELEAAATSSGAVAPTIFWTALDPEVVEVDGPTATAGEVGTGRVVASAGVHADTVSIGVAAGEPPQITTTVLAAGVVGQGYGPESLTAVGGDGVYSWAVVSGTLPPGLGLSAAGVVTGTPSVAGTFSFTVEVTSGGQTDEAEFSILVVVAGVVSWIDPTGGNWSDGANWSSGAPPAFDDDVLIALNGTYTVTVNVNVDVASLTIGGSAGAQTVTASSRSLGVAGPVLLSGTGTLDLVSSTLTATSFVNTSLNTLRIVNSTINGPVLNAGRLVARGASASINGPLGATVGATTVVEGDGSFGAAHLSVAGGIENEGAIEITSVTSAASSQLTVTGDPLVNLPGGTITSLLGAGGSRTVAATIQNFGLVTVAQALTVNSASADHTNSGTIALTGGGVIVVQSGSSPSVTNTGTLTIGAGHTFLIQNGSLNQQAGTMGGTGTLSLSGVTANFTTSVSNTVTGIVVVNSTLNGPGTFINAAEKTFALVNSTIGATMPFVNAGLFVARGESAVNGGITTLGGSTIRVEANGGFSAAHLVVAGGLTNSSLIEITSDGTAASSQLTVTGGPLVNGGGATIASLVGVGGARVLAADLTNNGTLALAPGAASLLTLTGTLTNAGTIAMDIGGAAPGTGYDRLAVSGVANLDGTLDVTLFGGFVPSSEASFTLLTFASHVGSFDVVNLPSPFGDPPSFTATTMEIVAPFIPGIVIWIDATGGNWSDGSNWNTGSPPTSADQVAIVLPGTYTVTVDTNPTVLGLTLGGGAGVQTLAASGRTIAVTEIVTVVGEGVLALTSSTLNTEGILNAPTGTVRLTGSTVNGALENSGTLIAAGASALNGEVTTYVGSVIQVGVSTNSTLTITSDFGFTNSGTIDLSNTSTTQFSCLVIVNDELVNVGTITTSGPANTNAGLRFLDASLENYGSVLLNHPFTLGGTAETHLNAGTIDMVNGNVLVMQGVAAFDNQGTIDGSAGGNISIGMVNAGSTFVTSGSLLFGPSQILTVVNGSFEMTGGTIGNGSLAFNSSAATFAEAIDVGVDFASLLVTGSAGSVSAPGMTHSGGLFSVTTGTINTGTPFANLAAQTLTVNGATLNGGLANAGIVVASGTATINGTVTTTETSTIQVGTSINSTVTIASGFRNDGTIDLRNTSATQISRLIVTTGTLENAGMITTSGAVNSNSANRRLDAHLDNQAIVSLNHPFTLGRSNGSHVNTGTMTMVSGQELVLTSVFGFDNQGTIDGSAGGDITIQMAGAGPGFVTSGSLLFGPSQTVFFSNGVVSVLGGATMGTGSLSFVTVVATFAEAIDIGADYAGLSLAGGTASVSAPGVTHSGGTFSVVSGTIATTVTPLVNQAGQTITLNGGTLNGGLANSGIVIAAATAAINGPVTTFVGSTIEVGTSVNTTLTVGNGFTNLGTIDLANTNAAQLSRLVVTSGVLVNEGTIETSGAGNTNPALRRIDASLQNASSGVVWLNHPFTLEGTNESHVNDGLIAIVNADDLEMTGVLAFDNDGTINASAGGSISVAMVNGGDGFQTIGDLLWAAGETLAFTNGSFDWSDGEFGSGSLSFANTVATLATPFDVGTDFAGLILTGGSGSVSAPGITHSGGTFFVTSGTIVTTGTPLSNQAGQTITLNGATLNGGLSNSGIVIASATAAINGAVTTSAGSTIQVGTSVNTTLTVGTGFTNLGTIDLANTNAAQLSRLVVTSGVLVNEGTVTTSGAANTSPALRRLDASLENMGTGMVTLNHPFTLEGTSESHVNSGQIILASGDDVEMTGVFAFDNSGTIDGTVGGSITVAMVNGGGGFVTVGDLYWATPETLSFTNGTFEWGDGNFGSGTLEFHSTVADLPTDIEIGEQFAGLTVTGGSAVVQANGITHSGGTFSVTSGTIETTVTPLSNQAGQTITLNGATLNGGLANSGIVITSATSAINGPVTAEAGSTLVVGTSVNSTLTVATGFQNFGTIELANTNSAQLARLVVTTASLVNQGTITTSGAANTNPALRRLDASLDNQGDVVLNHPFTLEGTNESHINTGTITLASGDDLEMTGVLAFDNLGTIDGSAGGDITVAMTAAGYFAVGAIGNVLFGPTQTLSLADGSFDVPAGATVGTGSLAFASTDATFAAGFDVGVDVAGLTLTGGSGSVSAPGITHSGGTFSITSGTIVTTVTPLSNLAGQTITLNGATVNGGLSNAGLVIASATAAINGAVTTFAGSEIQVGTSVNSTLTVATGFTNFGTLDLSNTNAAQLARLVVTSGTLVNEGTITTSGAANTSPALRRLDASLTNAGAGVMTLNHPFTLEGTSESHANAGTITLANGSDLEMTGVFAFDNSGTIDGSAGGSLSVAMVNGGGGFDTDGSIVWDVAETLSFSDGTFEWADGTFGGGSLSFDQTDALMPDFDVGVDFAGLTLTGGSGSLYASGIGHSGGTFAVTSATISTEAGITNGVGQTITLNAATVSGELFNAGTVIATGTSAIGALETVAGSTLQIGTSVNATLTVANSFTNLGLIRLNNTNTNQFSRLVVASGPLVNLGAIETTGVASSSVNRRIENEVIHRGTITLGIPMQILGYFAIPDTEVATVVGTGSALSALGGIGIDGALFDNAPFIVNGGVINQFDSVTFQNMDPAATQLTIVNDGIDGTLVFDDLSFLTTPTTGLYLSATETGGGNVLTINLTNATPANGDAFTAELSGASVTWVP